MSTTTEASAKLLDRLTPDYGVALLVEGEHDIQAMLDRLNAGEGVAILAMAENLWGVLRAMSVRCGPPALEVGRPYTLAAAKLVNRQPVIHWWVLRSRPES